MSLRYGPQVLHALLAMVAGITAIMTTKEERRAACLAIVDKVTRKDDPPGSLRRRAIPRR